MRPITKRIMELTIVFTVLLMVTTSRMEQRHTRHLEKDMQSMIQEVNQAMWDKFGPGTKQGYIDFFSETKNTNITGNMNIPPVPSQNEPHYRSLWDEIMSLTTTEMGDCRGFIAVESTPEWFKTKLAEIEPKVQQLQALLDKGPYLAAPGEIDFTTTTVRFGNDLGFQQAARVLRLLSEKDWLSGNREKAVQDLATGLRLGEALCYSPWLIDQMIRQALYSIGLQGFDTYAWTDPSPEDNRLLLAALEKFDTQKWEIPPSTENFLWNYLGNLDTNALWFYSKESEAVGVLFNRARFIDPTSRKALQKAGLIPRPWWRFSYEVSPLLKWTTLPAMRKRAERAPDSFFEGDAVFSPDTVKKFPRLVYLVSRYCIKSIPNFSNAATRMETTRLTAQVLQAAYRARCWRDEHKAWPTAEQMAALLPKGATFGWHVTEDARWLATYFENMNNPQSEDSMPYESHGYYGGPYPVAMPGYININQYRQRMKEVMGHFPEEIHLLLDLSHTEKANWVKGIFESYTGLVESVKVEDSIYKQQYNPYGNTVSIMPMKHITVHLRLPKRSYWVSQPGPGGAADVLVDEEIFVPYNPSNGLKSKGSIVQLAGWE